MVSEGKYNKNTYYKEISRDGIVVKDSKSVVEHDRQSQALLNQLADLHDALQSDAQIQAVGPDGLQQQTDQSAFKTWVDWHSADPSSSDATPQYQTQSDVNGIFNTLESMGVQLSTMPKDASTSQKLTQAWSDYQRWQSGHTNGDKLSAQQQVDTYV